MLEHPRHCMRERSELKEWSANGKAIFQGMSCRCKGSCHAVTAADGKPIQSSEVLISYQQKLMAPHSPSAEEASMATAGEQSSSQDRCGCQDKKQPPELRHSKAQLMP